MPSSCPCIPPSCHWPAQAAFACCAATPTKDAKQADRRPKCHVSFSSCINPFAGHTRAALAHFPEHHDRRFSISSWNFWPFPQKTDCIEPCLHVKAGAICLSPFSRDARLVSGILFRPQPAANGHDWPLLRRLGSVNSAANPTVTSLQRYPGL